MDKRTLLAVVLSVVVITAGFMIQNTLFPPDAQPAQEETDTRRVSESEGAAQEESAAPSATVLAASNIVPVEVEGLRPREVVVNTDLLQVVIDTRGGRITDFLLREHLDGGSPVDMIFNRRKLRGPSGYASAAPRRRRLTRSTMSDSGITA